MASRGFDNGRLEADPNFLVAHGHGQKRTASKAKAAVSMRSRGLGIFGPAAPAERKTISLVCIDGEVNSQLHTYKQEIADLRQQLHAMEAEKQKESAPPMPDPWPYLEDPSASKGLRALQQALESANQRNRDLEGRLHREEEAHRRSTTRLQGELEAQGQRNQKLQATVEDLQRRNTELEAQLLLRTEESAELERQLGERSDPAEPWEEQQELLLKEIAMLRQANEKLQVYSKDSSMLRALRAAETRLNGIAAMNRQLVAMCEGHGLPVPPPADLPTDPPATEGLHTVSLPALPSITEQIARKPNRCHSADASPHAGACATKESAPKNSAPGSVRRRPTTSQSPPPPVGVPPRPFTSPAVGISGRKG
eukprot:GGOE01006479.1.p1 GENE.GGOE01006479.1~~GGOE01006479.1.p1  ORF type:complete len:367 (-),score=95.72 GGOE01006479.1:580-1680(-)